LVMRSTFGRTGWAWATAPQASAPANSRRVMRVEISELVRPPAETQSSIDYADNVHSGDFRKNRRTWGSDLGLNATFDQRKDG
jgi:hypothetical protein